MTNFFLPFKGVYCRVSPIAFDGTLSFLELLGKLQNYVNELNASLNELTDTLEEFENYVNTALDGKQDTLTWDSTPTANSENPVYSKGIKSYVDDGLATKQDTLTWDSTPTANSNNPVYSKGIKTYVDNGLATKQDTLTWDSTPTANSENPVYSKGIKTYVDNGLAAKQDTLTWDSTPTANSNNPVYSRGIKSYVDNGLAEKQTIIPIYKTVYNEDTSVMSGTDTFADILVKVRQELPVMVMVSFTGINQSERNSIEWLYLSKNHNDTYLTFANSMHTATCSPGVQTPDPAVWTYSSI